MPSLGPRLLAAAALLGLGGCAAMITQAEPDEPAPLSAGTTEAQLTQRFGAPLQSSPMAPPKVALALWEQDHLVSLLQPSDVAVSESVFRFKGRLDKQRRVAQSGFDSFMTLGLAEVFLIPKALWQYAVRDELRLTVWFGADGRALAYKWAGPPFGQ